MKNFQKIILYSVFIIPVILVFRNLFLYTDVVWGDAPYFYNSELAQLFTEPSTWTLRGTVLGGVNQILWIQPILLILSVVASALSLNGDIAVKIIFLFPAILLSFIGPIFAGRQIGLSKNESLIGALFYCLNTYSLLLFDGGQVGVALSYSLLPFSWATINRYLDKRNHTNFALAFVLLNFNFFADPRIAISAIVMALITRLFLGKFKLSKIFNEMCVLLVLLIPVFLCQAFWLVPLTNSNLTSISQIKLSSQTTILDSLTLHQSHWPENIFGKTQPVPFYFLTLPLLISTALLFAKSKFLKPLFACYVILVFFSKGSSEPFGFIYEYLVNNLPLGEAFRDSTKLYPSLILSTALLISILLKGKRNIYKILTYSLVLLLVYQSLVGQLNFSLSSRKHNPEVKKISSMLINNSNGFKVLWFPERHTLSPYNSGINNIDAKELTNIRPIATKSVGSYDKFNYVFQDDSYVDWYRLFGIKYLVFSGDIRKKSLTQKEKEEWDTLIQQVSKNRELKKLEYFQTPVFEISNPKSLFLGSKTVVAVVGPDDTQTPKSPFVYFEDGIFNPQLLNELPKDSLKIMFNKSKQVDLTMSILSRNFIPLNQANVNEWAYYSSDNYLEYKYQLLIRKINITDLDYQKGLSFSEKENEHIVIKSKSADTNIFAMRHMGTGRMQISINGSDNLDIPQSESKMEWFIFESPQKIESVDIVSKSGVNIVNTVYLGNSKEFKEAEKLANVFVVHFGTIEEDNLESVSVNSYKELQYEKISENRYSVIVGEDIKANVNWITQNQAYNNNWILEKGNQSYHSLATHSTTNTFYKRPEWNKVTVRYSLQDKFRFGFYITLLSLLATAIVFLATTKNDQKNT